MNEHKSFRPSDFSLRDVPGFFVIYGVVAVFSVIFGLLMEQLPVFWRGTLFGSGITAVVLLFLLRPNKKETPPNNSEE